MSEKITIEKSNIGLRAYHMKKAGAGIHQTPKGRSRKGKFRRNKKWSND
jgi:hypothetical protein